MFSNRSASQISPFGDSPDVNSPQSYAAQRRRQQQNGPDIQSAVTGGIPAGGTTPFAGAQQTLGSQPQQQTQPNGPRVEQPAASAGQSSSGSNEDRFMSLLNDPQYKDNPQAAIDAFNGLGLKADSTGLSSNYGSSPAFYQQGLGQIGLPGAYLVKQQDGSWQRVTRSPEGPKANIQGAIGGFLPNQVNDAFSQATGSQGTDYAAKLQQMIMSALQGNPQLSGLSS